MPDNLKANGFESAATRMAERVPTAARSDTVEETRYGLVGKPFTSVEAVYVTDEDRRLLGVVLLGDLLAAQGEQTLEHLMIADPPAVRSHVDQETVASIAVGHRLPAVPVVDESGRLLGAVPQLALMDILRREHIEDLHRLAGMTHRSERARLALRDTPLHRVVHRLPWLILGLVGSGIAAWVVSRFADVLETWVVVAFFLPGIVYLADAIGTQTEAIAVRGLSLGEGRLRELLGREVATGVLIGSALALPTLPTIWLVVGDVRLATAVSLAIVAAGTVATAIGLTLPWALARAGKDPAYGSGPVATVIQDLFSLLIYFVLVRILFM